MSQSYPTLQTLKVRIGRPSFVTLLPIITVSDRVIRVGDQLPTFKLIGEASGMKKAKVPWARIFLDHDLFIASEYLPTDVELTDPSKIHRDVTESIMRHWYKRQEDGTKDVTFCFMAFEEKDPSGAMTVVKAQPASYSRTASLEARSQTKGEDKGKGKGKGKSKSKSKTKQRKGPIHNDNDSSMEEDIANELNELEGEQNDYDNEDEPHNLTVGLHFPCRISCH
jgi:hypothetical protein